MNDLDLPCGPFSSDKHLSLSYYAYVLCFISLIPILIQSFLFFQTRKFSIKVLVRVDSVLRVREGVMQEYGYNLQQDGMLNVFTDEKSQAMRSDGIP